MDKYGKVYCREEKRLSEQQFMTDIYLMARSEYIGKVGCNGEYIKVQLLNGQTFKIKIEEIG